MMTGRNELSYERLFRLNPLLRCLGGVLLITSFSTLAREYRFSPSSLEGDMLAQQDIDLSLFSKSNAQLPGTYSSRVQVNDRHLSTTNIAYVSSPEGSLIPQITPDRSSPSRWCKFRASFPVR